MSLASLFASPYLEKQAVSKWKQMLPVLSDDGYKRLVSVAKTPDQYAAGINLGSRNILKSLDNIGKTKGTINVYKHNIAPLNAEVKDTLFKLQRQDLPKEIITDRLTYLVGNQKPDRDLLSHKNLADLVKFRRPISKKEIQEAERGRGYLSPPNYETGREFNFSRLLSIDVPYL